MKRVLLCLAAFLVPAAALAADCDTLVGAADTAKGPDLVRAYGAVANCDSSAADGAFNVFLRKSTDIDTATGLALVAIDHQVYTPVWNMLERVKDYSQRDAIATKVGAACTDHPNVVQFLQGAYYGLRDIQFVAWSNALDACESPDVTKWMRSIIAKPPGVPYDEKYNAIGDAYVKHEHVDALPVLQRAAVAASHNGGPFNAIIDKMDTAVHPHTLGQPDAKPEDEAKLTEALVAVANAVPPEQAALVADRLYNAGAHEAAAGLLRRVYPDRVTAAGRLQYGAASIERCDKQAVLHYALVLDPAKRWSILPDLDGPMRAFKPRLKCDAKTPWPIEATPEPVKSPDDAEAWAEKELDQLTKDGVDAKIRKEKDVVLP